MIGTVVSHYRILERIGEGGMGVVYKAEDLRLSRAVALKFLPQGLDADEPERARFLQEARAAAILNHPNICTIHDIEEFEGQPFIVMEYVEGKTLREIVPLRTTQGAVRYATQIAEALHEAHTHGIVHRDIKPENILINKKDQVKVMDFGLARLRGSVRLTKTSSTIGTIAYMAPESIQAEEADARSDIFSLGIVFYELLTGSLPFRGEHEAAMVYSIVNDTPKPLQGFLPDAPPELIHILTHALEKDRTRRYQSAAEMLTDLHHLLPVTEERALSKERMSTGVTHRPRKRYWVAAAILLVLGVVAVFLLKQQTAPTGATGKSVAVLPFKNLSDSKEDEYFADGITEDIITQLSKISDLKVISRTSVMQYKGVSKNIREIGKELAVSSVLEGSVRRAGNQVRIVAQLIDAHDEGHLWADTYDKEMTQIFSIQSDVAQKIAGALRATLLPAERERIERQQTENTEAYQLYLKGRFYWNKRRGDDLNTAIDYFRQAIGRDSAYALAYAGLASTYTVLSEYSLLPQSQTVPKAQSAARRALEIDPTLAEPHAVLGMAKTQYEWDWPGSETELKRAIELNPGYATAHHWYCIFLRDRGRLDEAETEIRRAQQLDPLSVVINVNVGEILYLKGEHEKAIEQYLKTLELDPSYSLAHSNLGLAYILQGQFDRAIVELEKVRELVGKSPYGLGRLGHAYARAGKKAQALKVLEQLRKLAEGGYSVAYDIAFVYYGLGDTDKTFEWLEKAYQERHVFLCHLKRELGWEGLRSDPRFTAFVKRIGSGD